MYTLLGTSHGIGLGSTQKHRASRPAAVPRSGLARITTATPWPGTENARCAVSVRFKGEQAAGSESVEDPTRVLLPSELPSGHKVVTFKLHKHCQFGDVYAICGSAPELGAWDATKALPLKWTAGDKWLATVALQEDSKLEFKVVVLDSKNANKVKGWADDVTKGNIVLDMAHHNAVTHGCCSVQVLAPPPVTGARPPTTTTGLQPGMTVPVGEQSGAAESGAAATPVPPAATSQSPPAAHSQPAPPQQDQSSASAKLKEGLKAAEHKVEHAVESLKGERGPQNAGAEAPAPQGDAPRMPHIAPEHRDLTQEEVEKSRAAAGVHVFEAGPHVTDDELARGRTSETAPSVTVNRVVPPGSTVNPPTTSKLVSEPTGPEVTAWPAAAPTSSIKSPVPPSTATTPTPVSSAPVVSEQYSSGNAPAPAAAATTGASAVAPPAEPADISSSVAGMATPTTGAASSPVEAAGTGSSLSGMATPATTTGGGAAPTTQADNEGDQPKAAKGFKGVAEKGNRKQQQKQQQDKPKAAAGAGAPAATQARSARARQQQPDVATGSHGVHTPTVPPAEASKMLAQDAELELPITEAEYTAASVIDNLGGGDEELPMAPLASGVTPVTGSAAAAGSSVLNPKRNPIIMAAGTLLSKMSELLSGSADSVRTMDVPEDYEAAIECGSLNAEGGAGSKTNASPMYNPNLGRYFVYPSAALFTRVANEADRGTDKSAAAEGANANNVAPESGSQRDESSGSRSS